MAGGDHSVWRSCYWAALGAAFRCGETTRREPVLFRIQRSKKERTGCVVLAGVELAAAAGVRARPKPRHRAREEQKLGALSSVGHAENVGGLRRKRLRLWPRWRHGWRR